VQYLPCPKLVANISSVIWFNLGMHHLPSGSDLPNTVTTTAQGGIAIIPQNYLLGDPSIQTSHSVHLDLSGQEVEANVYGGEEATCAYDMVGRGTS
jgi:primary-amine oxidase